MSKTLKIAISLPDDILEIVERERKATGISRSQFFREAVEYLLKTKRDKEASEKYIQAYNQIPETEKEIKAARKAASIVLAGEPW